MGGILGGKKPKATSTSAVDIPKWLTSQNQELVNRAVSASNTPFAVYTGNRIADFNADTLGAFDKIRNQQGKYSDLINTSVGGVNQLFGRVNGPTAEETQALMNPYLQNVLNIAKRNSIEDFQTADTSARRKEALSGAFGGSRNAIAQSKRQSDFERNLSDLEMQGLFQGFNQARDQYNLGTNVLSGASQQALQTAQAGQEADYTDIFNLLKTGELQRDQQQAQEDFNYQEFDRQQAHPYENVNFLANIMNPMTNAYRGGTTTQTSSGGGGSKLGQALGVASSVAGLFGFSDERVKENIKEVGKLKNGMKVYSYNYKGMPQTMLGLLAQEVEKKNPDAVGEVGGIKTVNYDEATKKYADGGEVLNSRERLAKQYNPYQMSPFQFTQPEMPKESGGGDIGAGIAGLFGGGNGSSILSLFDNNYFGPQPISGSYDSGLGAYNSVLQSAANPFFKLAQGGAIINPRLTSPYIERFTNQPDDNVFTTTGKGLANMLYIDPSNFVTKQTLNAGKNVKDTAEYLYNTPSTQVTKDLVDTTITREPLVADDEDASMLDMIKQMSTGPRPNMPPSDDSEYEAYRQKMLEDNLQAVRDNAPPLPIGGALPPVKSVNKPYVDDIGVMQPAVSMPSADTGITFDQFKEMIKPAEVPEKEGFKLFGREVNVPLLVAGLTMLGADGDFGDQLGAGVKAGMDSYAGIEKTKEQVQIDAQKRSSDEMAQYLDYLRAMAYMKQVGLQGKMTPYQAKMLELQREKLNKKKDPSSASSVADMLFSGQDVSDPAFAKLYTDLEGPSVQ